MSKYSLETYETGTRLQRTWSHHRRCVVNMATTRCISTHAIARHLAHWATKYTSRMKKNVRSRIELLNRMINCEPTIRFVSFIFLLSNAYRQQVQGNSKTQFSASSSTMQRCFSCLQQSGTQQHSEYNKYCVERVYAQSVPELIHSFERKITDYQHVAGRGALTDFTCRSGLTE